MSNGKMLAELREMAEKDKIPQDVMNNMTMAALAEIIERQGEADVKFDERGECISDIKVNIDSLAETVQLKDLSRACRFEVNERIQRISDGVEENVFIRAGEWATKRPKTSAVIVISAMLLVDIIGHKILPTLVVDPNLLAYLESIIR